MTDLSPLIERVKALSSESREVDALVLCSLLAPKGAFIELAPLSGMWCIYSGTDRNGRPKLWEQDGGHKWRPSQNPVTSSIDAVLRLVAEKLPGWGFYLRGGKDGCGCGLVYPDAPNVTPAHEAAPTPALALLSALLSALQAQTEKDSSNG